MKKKRLVMDIVMFCILIYTAITFIKQQSVLISYSNEQKYVLSQIDEEKDKNKSLIDKKENINSTEYVEEVAREKLDMYKPNERVYLDVGI